MLYPFKIEYIPILRGKSLSKYSEIFPVALDGFQYDGSDVGSLDKGNELNILVTTNFEEVLNVVNDIIVTEVDDYILDNLKIAIKAGKNIICLQCSSDYEEIIRQLCCENNAIYSNTFDRHDFSLPSQNIDLALFDVPIIFVCGMSERTQKFDVFLDIYKRLTEKGYKVSGVSARMDSDVLSIHNFPSFLLEKNYEYDKVLYFNNYIKYLELTEQPDIIIIEVPGGIIPYDIKHNNKYGLLAYIVSQAISSVDYAIFSMAYNKYDKEFYDFMSLYTEYRYGFNIDMFHMSNCFHDLEPDGNEDIILMDSKKVVTKIDESLSLQPEIKIYNVFNNPSVVVEDIINRLGD